MKICVCDIGGTNFRMAVFENGALYDVKKIKTPNFYFYDEKEIKKLIVDALVSGFAEKKKIYADMHLFSVCFPGPVTREGEVIGSSVIFGTTLKERFFLKKELEERLPGVSVSVMNDLTAAAYRYMGNGNFCLITVSSGIGNKICIDDRVIIDPEGRTGEIGHYSADGIDLGIECTCGTGKDHVGMIASGRGVELIARRFAGEKESEAGALFTKSPLYACCEGDSLKLTAEMLACAADEGDLFSRYVIDFCTKPLASEICLLAIAMHIPKFIIIGGFALHCEYYMEALIRNVKKKGVYNFTDGEIEKMIVYGAHDDDHGLIGAGIAVVGSLPCREN